MVGDLQLLELTSAASSPLNADTCNAMQPTPPSDISPVSNQR